MNFHRLRQYFSEDQARGKWMPEWCKTEEDKTIYINNYYEKEGFLLTTENMKNNPGLRQLPKLILNRYVFCLL